jgi:hypothetical protein
VLTIKAVFEVKRRKQSVTQGTAVVYLNGVEIVAFADEYAIDGTCGDVFYKGKDDKLQWGSVNPDETFIIAALFPNEIRRKYYPRETEEIESKIKRVLGADL